jgi:hypothetical protein
MCGRYTIAGTGLVRVREHFNARLEFVVGRIGFALRVAQRDTRRQSDHCYSGGLFDFCLVGHGGQGIADAPGEKAQRLL